jgi:hypothetical protein
MISYMPLANVKQKKFKAISKNTRTTQVQLLK